MRVVRVFLVLSLLVGCTAIAQEPSGSEPVGSLAELMRAIAFPNSNILFDVQTSDPETAGEKQEGDSVTSTFSGIYKGWMVVDQAAIALASLEPLMLAEGRLCENGKPVPTAKEDFQQWVKQLTEAGKATLEASRKKDRDAVIELTNAVAGACEDCHTKYRRYQDRCRQ